MLYKYNVPPLALTVIMAALMYCGSLFFPAIGIPELLKIIMSLVILFVGLNFIVLGVSYFKKHKTTVNPTKPELATTLVTSGVYSITRNPMYVGFLLSLLAWGLYLSNVISLFMVLLFFIYMNKVQIVGEEKALALLFGEAYDEYTSRVRRWL